MSTASWRQPALALPLIVTDHIASSRSSPRQYCNLAIVLNAFESDDNNNCNNGKHTANGCARGVEENGRTNEHHNGVDVHARRLTNGKPALVCKTRSDSTTIAPDAAQNGLVEAANGQVDVACANGNLEAGCSLLRIKEKLEYHLISLKNILGLMSSSADYITQKYLDDIHCEDRFDNQAKSCDQNESIRHYYTSN